MAGNDHKPPKEPHKDLGTTLGPQARASLLGAKCALDDLGDAGGTYNLDEVQQLLKISPRAVAELVAAAKLLAIPGPAESLLFPKLQFSDDGAIVEGLGLLSQVFPKSKPVGFVELSGESSNQLGQLKTN